MESIIARTSTPLHDHVYRALPGSDRAGAVAERLRSSLSLGLVRIGERLPSETEMAESFGVSTMTLREALAQLRTEGLVETRRGRHGGTFVVALPHVADDDLQGQLLNWSVVELRDLGDHRTAVSAYTARLAAARTEDSDLVRLEKHLNSLAQASTAAERARADSRLWIETAVIAQSKRLLALELQLQLQYRDILWAPVGQTRSLDGAVRSAQDLLEALRTRDPDTAAGAVTQRIKADTLFLIDQHLTLTLHSARSCGANSTSARLKGTDD